MASPHDPVHPRPEASGSSWGAMPPAPIPPVDDPVQRLLEEITDEPEPQPLFLGRQMRGKVVIVTGGATGIGRAIATEFARQGAHVAFNFFAADHGDPIHEEAEATAREISGLEVRCYYTSCDIRDAGQVASFVGTVEEELGGVHILVNNAGIASDRALWRLTDDQWHSVLDTNLTGAFYMIRAVAPIFRRQADGKIVNVASIHGIRSEFGLANYAASKAGLLGLTRSAALELGPANVNVNAVAPGYIRTTRLTNAVPAELLDHAREKSVLGRLGDPQDVAHVVVFLCSELARHITGSIIPVDGGHLL